MIATIVAEGIVLKAQDEQLKLSRSFDGKKVLALLQERFETENYKIGEAS